MIFIDHRDRRLGSSAAVDLSSNNYAEMKSTFDDEMQSLPAFDNPCDRLWQEYWANDTATPRWFTNIHKVDQTQFYADCNAKINKWRDGVKVIRIIRNLTVPIPHDLGAHYTLSHHGYTTAFDQLWHQWCAELVERANEVDDYNMHANNFRQWLEFDDKWKNATWGDGPAYTDIMERGDYAYANQKPGVPTYYSSLYTESERLQPTYDWTWTRSDYRWDFPQNNTPYEAYIAGKLFCDDGITRG